MNAVRFVFLMAAGPECPFLSRLGYMRRTDTVYARTTYNDRFEGESVRSGM